MEGTLTDVTTLISQLGFPIAITVWLLWERHTAWSKGVEVIQGLKESIDRLVDRLDVGGIRGAPKA